MSLVSSNEAQFAANTVRDAIVAYHRDGGGLGDPAAATAALGVLTKLKGIGPATASLLLSVHDPDYVIFFSDEAFIWLCGGGKQTKSIKYNVNEYKALCSSAQKVVKRLGVSATSVEKVAFVLMKGPASSLTPEVPRPATKKSAENKRKPDSKTEPQDEPEGVPLRRSKRSKT